MPAEGAQAQTRYDIGGGRMGTTDASAEAGLQPRLWLVTMEHELISKEIELNEQAWTRWNVTGLDEDIDTVSWTSGATQYERVFYTRQGVLFVGSVVGMSMTEVAMPAAPDGLEALPNTDIAAVAFDDAGVQRIAVAAIHTGGRVCVWEGTFTGGFAAAPDCPLGGVNSLDIDGAEFGSTGPTFFVSASLGLRRIRRLGPGDYSGPVNLGRPPGTTSLRPSVGVVRSTIDPSRFEVAVLSNLGAHTARVADTGLPTWTSLGFPAGETISSDPEAVGIARWRSGILEPRMTFYVKPSDNELWFATARGNWSATWSQTTPPQGDRIFGVGTTLTVGTDTPGVSAGLAFAQTGAFAIVVGGFHLGEYNRGRFDDHLTYQEAPTTSNPEGGVEVLGFGQDALGSQDAGWHPANETVAAVHSIAGMATGIRRSRADPNIVVVSDSTDFGASYGLDYVVQPLTPGFSLSDPFVAYGPASAMAFLFTLEFTSSCSQAEGHMSRGVVRRGTSAADIAALQSGPDIAAFEMDHPDIRLDHTCVAVTGNPGAEIGHLIWFHFNAFSGGSSVTGTRYAQWSGGPAPTSVTLQNPPYSLPLENDEALCFRDSAAATRVWAATNLDEFPTTVCQLVPTLPGPCGVVASRGTCETDADCDAGELCTAGMCLGTPVPVRPLIFFGEQGSQTPERGCGVPDSPLYQRCVGSAQPVALAAHPTNGRVYATWEGIDPEGIEDATSIYLSRSMNSTMDLWSPVVRVNARTSGTATFFIDQAITVTSDIVIVTYSSIENNQLAPIATTHIAYSTDSGQTFTEVVRPAPERWRPEDLGQRCAGTRQWFLGEYRTGSTFGEKHYNTFPHSRSGAVTQTGLWSSSRSIW